MRWKEKPNMTDTTAAGSDVLPITDVSTDQDRKITLSIIATWAVTKFTTSVAGASQTIVAAINAVRSLANAAQSSANAAQSAASAAQSGVNQNAAAIQQANAAIAQNASGIASLGQEMDNTNGHVSDLEETVNSMDQRIDDAVQQANDATETAIGAANAAGEAAEAVQEIIDQGGTVLSVFGRSGIVEAQAGDYDSAQISHGEGTVADKLAFDTTPVVNSKKAVESGGVFTALGGKVSKAGDTMTGNLIIQGSQRGTNYKSTDIDSDIGETVPADERKALGGMYVNDKKGTNNGWIRIFKDTSDKLYWDLILRRNIPGGTMISNALSFGIDDQGNRYVSVTSPSAWRTALGLRDNIIDNSAGTITIPSGSAVYNNTSAVMKRSGIAVAMIAFQLPAGTYGASDYLLTLDPKPYGTNRFLVLVGTDVTSMRADSQGRIFFNASVTLSGAKYVLGEVVYAY